MGGCCDPPEKEDRELRYAKSPEQTFNAKEYNRLMAENDERLFSELEAELPNPLSQKHEKIEPTDEIEDSDDSDFYAQDKITTTPHEEDSAPGAGESEPGLVPVTFTWEYGAMKSVYVCGSFNRWATKMKLEQIPFIEDDLSGPSDEIIADGRIAPERVKEIRAGIESSRKKVEKGQKWHSIASKGEAWVKTWSTDLSIPAGQYYYKYVVDGEWRIDPNAVTGLDGNGKEVNVLVARYQPRYKLQAPVNYQNTLVTNKQTALGHQFMGRMEFGPAQQHPTEVIESLGERIPSPSTLKEWASNIVSIPYEFGGEWKDGRGVLERRVERLTEDWRTKVKYIQKSVLEKITAEEEERREREKDRMMKEDGIVLREIRSSLIQHNSDRKMVPLDIVCVNHIFIQNWPFHSKACLKERGVARSLSLRNRSQEQGTESFSGDFSPLNLRVLKTNMTIMKKGHMISLHLYAPVLNPREKEREYRAKSLLETLVSNPHG
ncbi:hypothetical protein BLNAU_10372 [Blattamonas nauphoetae]|uniref:AMP-activated protein kinase glycogen-binding domain-containing protein n=1 Tax=Blattamonas nauphoetae TaxID=2049346 RepID=A0ABQ9XTA4_9EUKA|nr:hypothetical protein BLNAU_10372 [Blattamonas nauphoetae]